MHEELPARSTLHQHRVTHSIKSAFKFQTFGSAARRNSLSAHNVDWLRGTCVNCRNHLRSWYIRQRRTAHTHCSLQLSASTKRSGPMGRGFYSASCMGSATRLMCWRRSPSDTTHTPSSLPHPSTPYHSYSLDHVHYWQALHKRLEWNGDCLSNHVNQNGNPTCSGLGMTHLDYFEWPRAE